MWKTSSARITSHLKSGCKRSVYTSRCRKAVETGTKSAESKPAQQPPPPPPVDPPKKSGGVFFKLMGLTAVAAGGVVGYAWYDPNFRKQIEDNVPYSKDAFSFIFQESVESSKLPDTQSKTNDLKPVKSSSIPTDEQPIWKKREARKESKDEQIDDKIEKRAEVPATKLEPKPMTDREKAKAEVEKRLKQKEMEEKAENAALEIALENLIESTTEKVKYALDIEKQVIDTTKKHTELLKTAMDDSTQILEKDSQWQAVANAFKNREGACKTAEKVLVNAKNDIEKLKGTIEDGKKSKITKKNKALITAQQSYNELSRKLNMTLSQIAKAEVEAKVMVKYKELIEQGRKQFKEELESIMPEVKIGDKRGKKLSEDELNSLIAHAHRRIEQLQRQQAEQQAMEQQRMQESLSQQQMEDEKVADIRVAQEAEKLRNEMLLEKENWNTEARVQFEQELRQQLARQAAAHSDHLKDVLKVQQHELEAQFDRDMHTKILEERQIFQTEVAGWIARLKGIETAVEGRAEAEKVARMAQSLWLACVALNGSVRLGNENEYPEEKQLKPLQEDVNKILDIAGTHPFINTVVQAIPEEALTRGVWTEENLLERFSKVRRVAKRVALIDETGGSLFKFFISYVQSFFIFDSVYAKIDVEEVDPESLSAFSILAHANYWLEHGDLEQAVRFINQLQGEPRRVASDWLKEAKLLLETRQAAHTLTAFASASGLGTIF